MHKSLVTTPFSINYSITVLDSSRAFKVFFFKRESNFFGASARCVGGIEVDISQRALFQFFLILK